MDKVDIDPSGCWLWTASCGNGGYGQFAVRHPKPTMVGAHRFAYEHFVGPIPAGLDLDHLCRNRRCVNPAHLEPVTRRENLLRGVGPAARGRDKVCRNGHPLTGDNLVKRKDGRRRCKTCFSEWAKRWEREHLAARSSRRRELRLAKRAE